MTAEQPHPDPVQAFDVRRIDVLIGFAVAAGSTAVLAPLVLAVSNNVWWVSVVAALAIGAGAAIAGLRAKQIEPLNGALLMALFFVAEAAIAMIREVMAWLPEPLSGLPVGDSTFFFVSPLVQLVCAVAGSLLGGWWATRRHAARDAGGGGHESR